MRELRRSTTVVLLCLGTLSAAALAHHSTNGIYNEDEIVELTGTVREWRFVNPHPSLILEVAAQNGTVERWSVSYGGAAVTHLAQRGYTAETFKPGDVVTARGFAAKVQTAHGLLIRGDPVFADGSSIIRSGE